MNDESREIWDDLLCRLRAAWPGQTLHWDETPLELITQLIDERDEWRDEAKAGAAAIQMHRGRPPRIVDDPTE